MPGGPQGLLGLHRYLGQFAGPHIGAGDPPSAKETVENAPSNNKLAKNSFATRFIGCLLKSPYWLFIFD